MLWKAPENCRSQSPQSHGHANVASTKCVQTWRFVTRSSVMQRKQSFS